MNGMLKSRATVILLGASIPAATVAAGLGHIMPLDLMACIAATLFGLIIWSAAKGFKS